MKTIKDREYSFNHTKLRLLERYGIDITVEDYEYLCENIKYNNDALLITMEKQKDDEQYIYDLNFKYKEIVRVVWSKERQCITTALER
jgi:hypothetical protein